MLNAAQCILVNGSSQTPLSMKCLVGDGKTREGVSCGNEKRSVQKVFFCTGGTNLAGKRCEKRAFAGIQIVSIETKINCVISFEIKMFQGDTAYR